MDFFVGTLMPFPYNFVTTGWLACNGQLLPIGQYQVLYTLIGTTYGGDGRQTFALPKLNATSAGDVTRAVMGQGTGPGLTPRVIGTVLGSDSITLDSQQLPYHTHGFAMPPVASGQQASATPPTGGVLVDQRTGTFAAPNTAVATLSPQTIGVSGQGQPHANDQPWTALYWCICYEGMYPQRAS